MLTLSQAIKEYVRKNYPDYYPYEVANGIITLKHSINDHKIVLSYDDSFIISEDK